MVVVRWVLARIILLVDFLFHPRGVKRDTNEQADIDRQTSRFTLYQYAACPFCVKVRWAMQRNSLNIEKRDAKRNADYAEELVAGGGRLKVPCLKVEQEDGSSQWVYESDAIIDLLHNTFPQSTANS